MCSTSAVGDYFRDRLPHKDYYPGIQPWIQPFQQQPLPISIPAITRQEFEALKHDVEELKNLLLAAKKFDEATGEPDCEVEDKVGLIKKLAALVGVSMDDVFGKEA